MPTATTAGAVNYDQLALALMRQMSGGANQTTKAVSSTPTTIYAHGNGGLFSYPGLDRRLFSAMILPRTGVASRLPVRPSMDQNPLYGIITGVTATTGSDPVGPCDDFPSAGLTKLCMHSFVYGRQGRSTRVFELDRIGLVANRADFTDLQWFGDPLAAAGDNFSVPTIPGLTGNSAANTEAGKALFELGVAWSRDFAREFYTGNPTNNTAQGGRKYYYGLDILLNTGYRDAVTGVACAAADSIVRSFGNAQVETNGALIVRQMTDIMRRLRSLSNRAGLDPTRWVIAMRQELFYQLTEVWPCAYLTYRCTNLATNSTNFVNANDAIAMRDEMRGDYFAMTGQYLMIDGQQVEVVLDDAIAETSQANGVYQSDIYFIPMTVLGSTPVTFFEYVNYDAPNGALAFAQTFAPDSSYYTTDGGRFLWHKPPPTNFCVQLLAKMEPRLLALTPYLGARLTNVRYQPLSHDRDPFTDSAYFVNGGSTSQLGRGPSFFSPTS
jgi:hypothetical protein